MVNENRYLFVFKQNTFYAKGLTAFSHFDKEN